MAELHTTAQRRAELDQRQQFVGNLLQQNDADHLLLFEPANISWFSGQPLTQSVSHSDDQPVIICTATQRWLICRNVDSRRLFDQFLNGLGFQLKEWPWHLQRSELLAGQCENKRVASDRLIQNARCVTAELKSVRLVHSELTQSILRRLGADFAHALEATGRDVESGVPEWEVAGQIAHRLAHRGIRPIIFRAAAENGGTEANRPCRRHCIISAVGERDGVHVAATRMICFGEIEPSLAQGIESAGRIQAARQLALRDDTSEKQLFDAGQCAAEALQCEHAWRTSSLGHWTGWAPIEQLIIPLGDKRFAKGHSVALSTTIGEAEFHDTFIISEAGAERITVDPEGSVRRYRWGERIIELPDLIRR